jgi:hypothetical protein
MSTEQDNTKLLLDAVSEAIRVLTTAVAAIDSGDTNNITENITNDITGMFARKTFKRKLKVDVNLDNALLEGDQESIDKCRLDKSRYMRGVLNKDIKRLLSLELKDGSEEDLERIAQISIETAKKVRYENIISDKGVIKADEAEEKVVKAEENVVKEEEKVVKEEEAEEQVEPCPNGAPSGFLMVCPTHTFQSYQVSGWTQEMLIDRKLMVKMTN